MTGQSFRIVIVEDNPADVYLFQEALENANLKVELTVIQDGAEAMVFVKRRLEAAQDGLPDLVVLDLNLPKNAGIEVLEALRRNPDLADVPVAVMSSSTAPRDRAKAMELGIKRFITKPLDLDEFLRIGEVLKQVLLENPERNASS